MLNLLTLSILLPLLGAGAVLLVFALYPLWSFLLSLGRRVQRLVLPSAPEPEEQGDQEHVPDKGKARANVAYYTALATAFLTLIPVAVLANRRALTSTISSWRSFPLLDSALVLQADALVQPLVLAWAVVTCSAFLAELARPGERHPKLASTTLTLLATGIAALWAANLLTALIAWTIHDLVKGIGVIAAGKPKRNAVRVLILSILSTLLVWGGALVGETTVNSEHWSLMTLSDIQTRLWGMVAILRLAIYPFHLSAPSERSITESDTPSLPAISLSLTPVIGWGILLRIVSAGGEGLLMAPWVLTLAAASLALGGALAWSAQTPRCSLPWVGMAVNGAVLLSAGLATATGLSETSEPAMTIIGAGGTAWMLGVTALFLGSRLSLEKKDWWRGIPSLTGALALSGAPPTLGFVTMGILMSKLAKEARPWWLCAYFLGQVFLVAALARALLSPIANEEGEDIRGWKATARDVGMGAVALLLVVTSMYPQLLFHHSLPSLGTLFAAPGAIGWLLWAIPLAVGGFLGWQDGRIRSKIELALSALHNLLSLEWLYNLVTGAFEQGLTMLRLVDRVLGGAGALLWSWILFLIMLLFWRGK